jgi:predicted glycosyltransferase
MNVWIDLANSPHVLLFAPIARRLESLGHAVIFTARDNAQTIELARERWADVALIVGPNPGGRRANGKAMLRRVRDLARRARVERPDVAVSHIPTGRSAARARDPDCDRDGPSPPAGHHLVFRLVDRVLLPSGVDRATVRRQGANPTKMCFYDGLKKEIYLGDFEPDGACFAIWGRQRRAIALWSWLEPPFASGLPPVRQPAFRRGTAGDLESTRGTDPRRGFRICWPPPM